LADTHRNSNVTDKLRLMMMIFDRAAFSILACSASGPLRRMQVSLHGTAVHAEHIRHQFTSATFRRHLKTLLFAEAFNTT